MQEYAFQLFAHSASRAQRVCPESDVSRTLRCDSPRDSMARRTWIERPRLPSPSHLGVRVSRARRDGTDRRGIREADSGVGGVVGVAWIRAESKVT